jgi:hypothetical protein
VKPPGWYELKYVGRDSREPASVLYAIRIKRWHPGYWLFALRVLLGR